MLAETLTTLLVAAMQDSTCLEPMGQRALND